MRAVHIVSAFPGCGKTTLHSSCPEVLDSDSSEFPKTGFPQNYLGHIYHQVKVSKKSLLVSSHEVIRVALSDRGFDFLLVYPSLACKDEYLERYRQRGSSESFIQLLTDNFENWVRGCQQHQYCTRLELQPGQFLADVIKYDKNAGGFVASE